MANRKRTQKQKDDLLARLEKYVEETDIPIVAEFAYQNRVRRQYLYENPLFQDSIKRLIDKKEAQLERGGLDKSIDKTMAIFSLKQLGWKDVQDVNVGFNAAEIVSEFAKAFSASGAGQAT